MDDWTLRDEINLEPLNLCRSVLLIAKSVAYPDLKIPIYFTLLDDLADKARTFITPSQPMKQQAVELAQFLFVHEGFKGNVDNYYDPRNSYLNELLERYEGIPISLSILYMEIARRLHIQASGVGLPGHFIVRVDDADQKVFIDPFHDGRQISADACVRLVRNSTGYQGNFDPAWLDPTPPIDILIRVLNNLRGIYVDRQEWPEAAAVVQQLRLIQPDVPEHIRDLGLIYYRSNSLRLAAHYLEDYILRVPKAVDVSMIRKGLATDLEIWARMN